MTVVRCVYITTPPDFPPTDQHPDALRYGPRVVDGITVLVDAIGGEPTDADIRAVLDPPSPVMTVEQRLDAAGISIDGLKTALGLA
jgi:hypothetical protein